MRIATWRESSLLIRGTIDRPRNAVRTCAIRFVTINYNKGRHQFQWNSGTISVSGYIIAVAGRLADSNSSTVTMEARKAALVRIALRIAGLVSSLDIMAFQYPRAFFEGAFVDVSCVQMTPLHALLCHILRQCFEHLYRKALYTNWSTRVTVFLGVRRHRSRMHCGHALHEHWHRHRRHQSLLLQPERRCLPVRISLRSIIPGTGHRVYPAWHVNWRNWNSTWDSSSRHHRRQRSSRHHGHLVALLFRLPVSSVSGLCMCTYQSIYKRNVPRRRCTGHKTDTHQHQSHSHALHYNTCTYSCIQYVRLTDMWTSKYSSEWGKHQVTCNAGKCDDQTSRNSRYWGRSDVTACSLLSVSNFLFLIFAVPVSYWRVWE